MQWRIRFCWWLNIVINVIKLKIRNCYMWRWQKLSCLGPCPPSVWISGNCPSFHGATPTGSHCWFSPILAPTAANILSLQLRLFWTFHKWDPTLSIQTDLGGLTEHHAFRVLSLRGLFQPSIPFPCWVVFHGMDAEPACMYSFVSWWTLGCSHSLLLLWLILLGDPVKGFMWSHVLISLEYISGSEIARKIWSLFNSLRNCQTVACSCRAPCYIPTNSVWWAQFLHIVTNTYYYLCFWL